MKYDRIVSLALTLALGALAACESTVQGGGGGEDAGDDAGSTSQPSSRADEALIVTATTRWVTPELEAELCASSFPCDLPDGSMLLVLDSAGPVCESPVARPFGQGDGFRVALALPPELQVEGYYVLDGRANVVMTQGFEQGGGATAAGGSWGSGAIEIVAADDLELTIRTVGLTNGVVEVDEDGNETHPFDSDGEYVTVPCED